jgi:anaerobic ribonucleoside-triphosphate reductase activating protein
VIREVKKNMLSLASYDIVFQEVPGEVTLALNLSACPNNCLGCHSPHLREAVGEMLDDELLDGLLTRYGTAVTCVGFMGGDGEPSEVNRLAAKVHATTELKTAWYSGRESIAEAIGLENFDYIKLGPYDPARGGLDKPDTNQRFYRVEHTPLAAETLVDVTALFRKKTANLGA